MRHAIGRWAGFPWKMFFWCDRLADDVERPDNPETILQALTATWKNALIDLHQHAATDHVGAGEKAFLLQFCTIHANYSTTTNNSRHVALYCMRLTRTVHFSIAKSSSQQNVWMTCKITATIVSCDYCICTTSLRCLLVGEGVHEGAVVITTVRSLCRMQTGSKVEWVCLNKAASKKKSSYQKRLIKRTVYGFAICCRVIVLTEGLFLDIITYFQPLDPRNLLPLSVFFRCFSI